MEAWAAEGGYKVAVYKETKSGEGYRKLVEYGDEYPLDAGRISLISALKILMKTCRFWSWKTGP